ncbi:MAG: recombinase family protein [Deltaproteobacteria bacterium]|nr:recombinase family protein [Deltaproteobacteria bacterium]
MKAEFRRWQKSRKGKRSRTPVQLRLIVDDLSRLTRSLGNLLSLYEMLRWYEVELISICDGISSEDVSAKTFFTVKGMVNDFTNDIHAERVIRGMEIRALAGFSCGDHPYGYDSEATKFENAKGRPFPSHFKIVINEVEAQTVRRIFSMYDLGLGFIRIAKALNEERTPSPGLQYAKAGKAPVWSPRGVQHILKNEKYIGIWKWKKTKIGLHPETKLRCSKARPITDWVSHMEGKQTREDLRIVEQDVWDRVQKKFEENQKDPADHRKRGRRYDKKSVLPEHPFSGILECGVCASNLLLLSGRRGGYYGCVSAHRQGICENRMMYKMDHIEKMLIDILKTNLTPNVEVIDAAFKHYERAIRVKTQGIPARLQQIEDELGLLESELKNLIAFVIRGAGSESINAEIKNREVRKARLTSEIHSLRRVQPKMTGITKDEIRARMETMANAIAERPMDCFPAIRKLFPRKVRVLPKGKAIGGRNLYALSGRLLLNGGLATNFDRLVSNKKGAANLSQPPFSNFKGIEPHGSKERGFDTLEKGCLTPSQGFRLLTANFFLL